MYNMWLGRSFELKGNKYISNTVWVEETSLVSNSTRLRKGIVKLCQIKISCVEGKKKGNIYCRSKAQLSQARQVLLKKKQARQSVVAVSFILKSATLPRCDHSPYCQYIV
jgi:hypothetical protein